jgi:lipopolysaccharide assembly protein B
MTDLPPLVWFMVIAALVLGILAGHFGWGRRWPKLARKLDPDYVAGLDYLANEQPDRALDSFLKLMDANADTIETHFALGSLYRRRGEVERAIRIHENLLARNFLPAVHKEQALLALAQDHLRAGLLDRAERLFLEVAATPRLKGLALDALRKIYEQQRDWVQALANFDDLVKHGANPSADVAAHYWCELAALAADRGDLTEARRCLRSARAQAPQFPRAALLRSRIAERMGETKLAEGLARWAIDIAPQLLPEEIGRLLALTAAETPDAVLAGLLDAAQRRGARDVRRLILTALVARVHNSPPLREPLQHLLTEDPVFRPVWDAATPVDDQDSRLVRISEELSALLSQAEKYRCSVCGFSARAFFWQCPSCQEWDRMESHTVLRLR